MSLVRIIKDWDWPDLRRQTPRHSGVWDNVEFTMETVTACDYVLVLNGAKESTTVCCPPRHVWSLVQEPPAEFHRALHRIPAYSARMFTTDPERVETPYVHSQAALPWHVDRDYDYLSTCTVPEKTRPLSWITSTIRMLRGHRDRMAFLESIRDKLPLDLWGRGIRPLADKWEGLASYQYSLAIENYSNPFYWTEKLADCFLAWTMPVYYGCTRITDYFPAEAMIQIDIHQPEIAIGKINEAIANNAWKHNLSAIAHARELVLNRYQLFPFMVEQIRRFESIDGAVSAPPQSVLIEPNKPAVPQRVLQSGLRRWFQVSGS